MSFCIWREHMDRWLSAAPAPRLKITQSAAEMSPLLMKPSRPEDDEVIETIELPAFIIPAQACMYDTYC